MPGLAFGQVMQVLTDLYRVRPQESGKLTARVKKVQRAGIPVGVNVGKGPRVRYSLDQLFQLITVLELAELSISLTTASSLIREFWPESPVSLAPAHAWFMSQDGEADSLVVLASAAEIEGLSSYRDVKEAATAQAAAFIVGAEVRPWDRLSATRLSSLIIDGKLNLSRSSLSGKRWRTSLIDCSILTSEVTSILAKRDFVSAEQFSRWARNQCDVFETQRQEAELLSRHQS